MMVLWKQPLECDYEALDREDFPAPRFSTLNYTTDKKKQEDINYSFQIWLDMMAQSTMTYMRISQ